MGVLPFTLIAFLRGLKIDEKEEKGVLEERGGKDQRFSFDAAMYPNKIREPVASALISQCQKEETVKKRKGTERHPSVSQRRKGGASRRKDIIHYDRKIFIRLLRRPTKRGTENVE